MLGSVGNIRLGLRQGVHACRRRWENLSGGYYRKGVPASLLFLLVVVVAAWLGVNMHVLGYRFWTAPEIEQDYAMGVIWWCVFALGILAFAEENRQMLLVAWTGKFFVVLAAMLFYEYSYGLDAGGYHLVAKTGYHDYFPGIDMRNHLNPFSQPTIEDEVLRTQGGTINFIRLMVIMGIIVGPFYHAIKVALAFVGFIGVWFFYRAIVIAIGRSCPAAFYGLAFFPSIIFWSSILGKDPVLFCALGIYAYGVSGFLVQGRLLGLCPIGVGLAGCYAIRPWMSMIAGGAVSLAIVLGRARRWQRSVVLLAGLAAILALGEDQLSRMFRIDSGKAQEILSNPTNIVLLLDVADVAGKGLSMTSQETGGSGADMEGLMTAEGGMGVSLPLAIFSGFFRPLPFDITNPFTALAAIENTLVFCLAIAALLQLRFIYLRDPLVLCLAAFCFIWATAYGFIVMANFGAGVRYKLQMWPFLLMLLLSLAHREGRALLKARASNSLP